jgi:acetylornithine deacetylase
METTPKSAPEVQPRRLRKLLRELTDIYSPSGKEEEILEYTEQHLKKHGMSVERQTVDENRFNLVVFPDKSNGVDLCFVGHLDTVVAFDLEDYGFREEGDTLYGLGITDMKAGCAAMIEAFCVLAETKKALSSVGLALVVGEEQEGDGAKTLVREHSIPWAVVGEPTNLVPCLGHYGYLEVLLRTRGRRAHSSMPELGQNAIETMLKLLLKLTEYADNAPHGLVYNIRQLTGFPGGFVVPDSCEAWLDLHLPPDSRMDILKAELEQLVEGAIENIPGMDAYIRFENAHSGYLISQKRPLVGRLKEAYRKMSISWKPQVFRSHSDANILWAGGTDPIILGPGQLETAHTPEESVEFSQVIQAAQLYLSFARSVHRR